MDWPPKEEDLSRPLTIRALISDKYLDDTPTVKVYVGVLNSTKHISKLVKALNDTSPIPSLKHLKRVRRHEGKSYVILDLYREQNEEPEECPLKKAKLDASSYLEELQNKGFDYKEFEIVGVEICDVPVQGPLTKVQYKKAIKYWPVNFHPEKKLETMMSEKVFENDEEKHHLDCMRQVMRKGVEEKKNAALVVDFMTKQSIAAGTGRDDHPLQHAIMVAIDAVASTQGGGAWDLPFDDLTFTKIENRSGDEGPYLCTGYDLYVLREPCVMCAMALVHSRIKRVFFHVRDPERGALVSRCQIHTIKDLNHHYEVFEVMKEGVSERVAGVGAHPESE